MPDPPFPPLVPLSMKLLPPKLSPPLLLPAVPPLLPLPPLLVPPLLPLPPLPPEIPLPPEALPSSEEQPPETAAAAAQVAKRKVSLENEFIRTGELLAEVGGLKCITRRVREEVNFAALP